MITIKINHMEGQAFSPNRINGPRLYKGLSFDEWLKAMPRKKSRGGKRPGAGRPKTKEDTVVMRVPKSLVPKVKEMIANQGEIKDYKKVKKKKV